MNKLQAGFARIDITPMLGIPLRGYYQVRLADGVLDGLEINALALACGANQAVLLSMDLCGIDQVSAQRIISDISYATGLGADCILLAATHTHTGPVLPNDKLMKDVAPDVTEEYFHFLRHKAADAARIALRDLKPAKVGWGIGTAPNIAFSRRFRMKDGSVRTNPGLKNPDILHPIGEIDERVTVLRFDRDDADSIVLTHFSQHADSVGGCKLSSDWPGFLRKTVEQALDHTKCIYVNGAEGDVGHINVWPKGGDLNDTFMDFDDVIRGYGHARYMGRVIAGGVLQAFDKVQYTDVTELRCLARPIHVPANVPTPEELPEAHRIHTLHQEGKDNEIPYEGMMLTTVVAEAARMVHLEHGPKNFEMTLCGVALGDIALIGIPGEPFTGVGVSLKESDGWALVIPLGLTNGMEGYFPMREAYDEGGYEARSSPFKAGVAELIIEEGQALLNELKDR